MLLSVEVGAIFAPKMCTFVEVVDWYRRFPEDFCFRGIFTFAKRLMAMMRMKSSIAAWRKHFPEQPCVMLFNPRAFDKNFKGVKRFEYNRSMF